jgi:hypothetical protein
VHKNFSVSISNNTTIGGEEGFYLVFSLLFVVGGGSHDLALSTHQRVFHHHSKIHEFVHPRHHYSLYINLFHAPVFFSFLIFLCSNLTLQGYYLGFNNTTKSKFYRRCWRLYLFVVELLLVIYHCCSFFQL